MRAAGTAGTGDLPKLRHNKQYILVIGQTSTTTVPTCAKEPNATEKPNTERWKKRISKAKIWQITKIYGN